MVVNIVTMVCILFIATNLYIPTKPFAYQTNIVSLHFSHKTLEQGVTNHYLTEYSKLNGTEIILFILGTKI